MSPDETHRLTYSSLRWLLALLPGVLFVVTVATAIVQGHLEGSISAYYGGPVRDVFVDIVAPEDFSALGRAMAAVNAVAH